MASKAQHRWAGAIVSGKRGWIKVGRKLARLPFRSTKAHLGECDEGENMEKDGGAGHGGIACQRNWFPKSSVIDMAAG